MKEVSMEKQFLIDDYQTVSRLAWISSLQSKARAEIAGDDTYGIGNTINEDISTEEEDDDDD